MKKSKGNRYFYIQDFDKAIYTYFEASLGLDISNSDKSKQNIMILEFKLPILSNLA